MRVRARVRVRVRSELSSSDAQAEELGLTAKEVELLVHRAEIHVARTARLRRQQGRTSLRKGPPLMDRPWLPARPGTRIHTLLGTC